MNNNLKLSTIIDSYTVFEENQVLTSGQLNNITEYLDRQHRLSRVKLTGIGIVCGLNVYYKSDSITITKGCAITSDGDLLFYEQDMDFKNFRAFNDTNANYSLFKPNGTQIPLFELLTEEGEGDPISTFEDIVTTINISDLAVLLYLESYEFDPDICTGGECDNKGKRQKNNLKALLISKPDLDNLMQRTPQIEQHYFNLENFYTERVLLNPDDINNYNDLKNTHKTTMTSIINNLIPVLENSYTECHSFLDDIYGGNDPTGSWGQRLNNLLSTVNMGMQYLYDFLKDIISTYNEFVEILFEENVLCCPDVHLFPKHIMLDSLVKDTAQPYEHFRHRFFESPILNNKSENLKRAKFLHKRIDLLIKNFSIPSNDRPIKITPDKSLGHPLGSRAIPYYYSIIQQPAEITAGGITEVPLNENWDYKLYLRRKNDTIYSYNADQYSERPHVLSPLNYCIEGYNFFRIEGHLGKDIQVAEQGIKDLIAQYNLPFKVISLQIERDLSSIVFRPGYWPGFSTGNLKFFHSLFRRDINQNLTNLITFNDRVRIDYSQAQGQGELAAQQVAVNQQINNLKLTLFPHASSPQPFNYGGFNYAQFETDYNNMVTALGTINQNVKLQTTTSAFTPYESVLNHSMFSWLRFLTDQINKKEEKAKELSIFTKFLSLNPAMEHLGGVKRNGTFILVYSSSDNKVVADFALPCCYFETITDTDEEIETPEEGTMIDWGSVNDFQPSQSFLTPETVIQAVEPSMPSIIGNIVPDVVTSLPLVGNLISKINAAEQQVNLNTQTINTSIGKFGGALTESLTTYTNSSNQLYNAIFGQFLYGAAGGGIYGVSAAFPGAYQAPSVAADTTVPSYTTNLPPILQYSDPQLRFWAVITRDITYYKNILNAKEAAKTITPEEIAIRDQLEATTANIIANSLTVISQKEADIQPGSQEQIFLTELANIAPTIINQDIINKQIVPQINAIKVAVPTKTNLIAGIDGLSFNK